MNAWSETSCSHGLRIVTDSEIVKAS